MVQVTPLPAGPSPALLAALERVTQAAFGQRRKMLRSSLKPLGGEALCAAAGIDASLRAEAVPVEGFFGAGAIGGGIGAYPSPSSSSLCTRGAIQGLRARFRRSAR